MSEGGSGGGEGSQSGENTAQILASFFEQLAEDKHLYDDYLSDPLAVMRDKGLPEDIINKILEGDLQGLHEVFTRDSSFGPVILGTIVRG
jgi:hypothetical protein